MTTLMLSDLALYRASDLEGMPVLRRGVHGRLMIDTGFLCVWISDAPALRWLAGQDWISVEEKKGDSWILVRKYPG